MKLFRAKTKKAQAIIESTLAYTAAMAILTAAVSLWAAGLAELGTKQGIYWGTRKAALMPQGRSVSEDGAQPAPYMAIWPLYY